MLTIDPGVTATVNDVGITDGSAYNGGGIYNGGTLILYGSTVSGNSASYEGGGIYNPGQATVEASTISNNTATYAGGGASNGGTTTFENSTVSNNVANTYGGGIIDAGGTVTVEDSTISTNTAEDDGGGIYNNGAGASVTVENSTIANNQAPDNGDAVYSFGPLTIEGSTISGNPGDVAGEIDSIGAGLNLAADILASSGGPTPGGECVGTITDDGYNVADDASCGLKASTSVSSSKSIDAYLGSLGANGGPTETVPLLANSSVTPSPGPDPAFGVIPSSFVLPTGETACSDPDQRGVARTAPCDIGAFEVQTVPGAPIAVMAANVGANSAALSWTAPSSDGRSVITSYTVIPSPGCGSCTGLDTNGSTTLTTVHGLTTGVMYTFSVQATNAVGSGPLSSASVGITPNAQTEPDGIAVDPVTNTIYVTNGDTGSWTVSVFDGATCRSTTESNCNPVAYAVLGSYPASIAVDASTNTVYVAGSSRFAVIDGSTCDSADHTDCTPVTSVPIPGAEVSTSVAINATTNTVYIGDLYSNMTVIDGATCDAADQSNCSPVGTVVVSGVGGVAINSTTNTIYVTNSSSSGTGTVAVIDGTTCDATDQSNCTPVEIAAVGSGPTGIDTNAGTNTIYVANYSFGHDIDYRWGDLRQCDSEQLHSDRHCLYRLVSRERRSRSQHQLDKRGRSGGVGVCPERSNLRRLK